MMPNARRSLATLLALALAGCVGGASDADPCRPSALVSGLVLVLTSTFETSSLDAFSPDCLDAPAQQLVAAPGDAILHRLMDGRVLIVGRGASSSLTLIGDDLRVRDQLGLPDCGAADVQQLVDGRVLVSCYDDTRMRLVDLAARSVSDGPDLAAFADADGLPEMDHLALAGGRVYVSVQRLDRNAGYAPRGRGLVAALDAMTLALVDADLDTATPDGWELPCDNPFTELVTLPGPRLAVGCSGSFVTGEGIGLALFDPVSGSSALAADATALGGAPTALARDADGALYGLVAVTAAGNAFDTLEMRALRLEAGVATTLFAHAGFSLAGLAVAGDGTVYVGSRATDGTAGLYRVGPAGVTDGPHDTSLPPSDLIIY